MRYLLPAFVLTLLYSCDTAPATPPNEKAVSYEEMIVEVNPETAAREATEIRAAASVEVDPALELTLWAADSLVNDPIAISIAPDGRLFYSRAERMKNSEFDVRGHMDWTEDIMALQHVEERREFLRRTFAEGSEQSEKHLKDLNNDGVKDWRDLAVETESIWFLTDRNGDGVADRTQRYLNDFNTEVTDVANGLAYINNELYVAAAPDLWKAGDDNEDGTADRLESLATGFGVHIGFSGHGMSGVTVGPQGRIWWGIGDIGSNVVDQGGKEWKNPNRGVIARCDPDGSNFEIFAHGVRNTHEFAFDAYGNLISVDNDGDHAGERERLVYLIDGSDTGWRINWQYGKYTDPKNNNYKVWMDEKMYLPRNEDQAAYFLPPIQNYVNGPTGLVFNPGTGLGAEWKDHFFVAEFRGGPGNSPIHAFTMEPDGAGFKLGSTKEIVRGLLPTGLDFGPDGALYFGDWINGWGAKAKGKIWKLDLGGDAGAKDVERQSTAALMARDFSVLSSEELVELLGHSDQRIRLKAQFTLAKSGPESLETLRKVAVSSAQEMARVHSIWGMAQVIRQHDLKGQELLPLLTATEAEIIAQAAKVVGDLRIAGGEAQLIDLVQHRNPRVRFFAAEALGRLGEPAAIDPIIDMLRENNDKDVYLRQAGMIALGRIGHAERLAKLAHDPSRAVRTAAVVALRRIGDERIADFLYDRDPYIVAEAARGIHDDFSVAGAMPKLAAMLSRDSLANEVVLRRAISANLRLGKDENVDEMLAFITRADAPEALRADALLALGTWESPSVFDRVTGRFRGRVTRDGAHARASYEPLAEQLLTGDVEAIRLAALRGASSLGGSPQTVEVILRNDKNPAMRAAALSALNDLEVANLDELLLMGLKDDSDLVRSRALSLLPESAIDPEKTVTLYSSVVDNGSVREAQTALSGLRELETPAATTLLNTYFERLRNNDFPEALRLDLIDALEGKEDATLRAALEAFEAELRKQDSLGYYVFALNGGNKNNGRGIFYWNSSGQCTRCHAVFEYGGNVGPNLEGLANRLSPKEILTSIVHPSATLAPGYETVLISLKDDSMLSGTLLERSDAEVTIRIGKTETKTISYSDIAEMETLPSSMPSAHEKLTRREIRDLVSWLSTLKGAH